MDAQEIREIRDQITELWRRVERPGVDQLIEYLDSSDFYQAPCSTQYHLAEPGGLAKHSLNVYELLNEKVDRYGLGMSRDSVIVCGLGHDLCKVHFYQKGGEPCSDAQYNYLCSLWHQKKGWFPSIEAVQDLLNSDGQFKRSTPATHATLLIDWLKNRPGEDCPKLQATWVVDDKLPLGHGEKSMSILQNYIWLTPDEKMAIRWHMTAFDASIHFDYPNGHAFRAAAKIPLVTLLFTADYEASQILEAAAS